MATRRKITFNDLDSDSEDPRELARKMRGNYQKRQIGYQTDGYQRREFERWPRDRGGYQTYQNGYQRPKVEVKLEYEGEEPSTSRLGSTNKREFKYEFEEYLYKMGQECIDTIRQESGKPSSDITDLESQVAKSSSQERTPEKRSRHISHEVTRQENDDSLQEGYEKAHLAREKIDKPKKHHHRSRSPRDRNHRHKDRSKDRSEHGHHKSREEITKFTRPDELRPTIQSRVTAIVTPIVRDETASYKDLPVERAKVMHNDNTFFLTYTVIQLLEDHVIGLLQPDMNGKAIPFLDLSDAHLCIRSGKPQIFDQFKVKKFDAYPEFNLPWDLEGTQIENFMKHGRIVPGGKALTMSLIKKDESHDEAIPAVIFLVPEGDVGYVAKVLLYSGDKPILTFTWTNSNLLDSIRQIMSHSQYKTCWATLRVVPKESKFDRNYVLPPKSMLTSDGHILEETAWTVTQLTPLGKTDSLAISNFLPGQYRPSPSQGRNFIEFYECFSRIELDKLITTREALMKDTRFTAKIRKPDQEASEIFKITVLLDFDDISDDFIKLWQRGAMFQLTEFDEIFASDLPFASGLVLESKIQENDDGMYEKFEISAVIWPFGTGNRCPSRSTVFINAVYGELKCIFTLDMNLMALKKQQEFFKHQRMLEFFSSVNEEPNMKILKYLMGFLEFDEKKLKRVKDYDIRAKNGMETCGRSYVELNSYVEKTSGSEVVCIPDSSSPVLKEEQHTTVAKLLNPKIHLGIIESSSQSDKSILLAEYSKTILFRNDSARIVILFNTDFAIKCFIAALKRTPSTQKFAHAILALPSAIAYANRDSFTKSFDSYSLPNLLEDLLIYELLKDAEKVIAQKYIKLRSNYAYCSNSCQNLLEILLKHSPIKMFLVHKDAWVNVKDLLAENVTHLFLDDSNMFEESHMIKLLTSLPNLTQFLLVTCEEPSKEATKLLFDGTDLRSIYELCKNLVNLPKFNV